MAIFPGGVLPYKPSLYKTKPLSFSFDSSFLFCAQKVHAGGTMRSGGVNYCSADSHGLYIFTLGTPTNMGVFKSTDKISNIHGVTKISCQPQQAYDSPRTNVTRFLVFDSIKTIYRNARIFLGVLETTCFITISLAVKKHRK